MSQNRIEIFEVGDLLEFVPWWGKEEEESRYVIVDKVYEAYYTVRWISTWDLGFYDKYPDKAIFKKVS